MAKIRRAVVFALCATVCFGATDTFYVTQDMRVLNPGDRATFRAGKTSDGTSLKVDWGVSPQIAGAWTPSSDPASSLTFTAREIPSSECVQVAVTATSGQESHTLYLVLNSRRTLQSQEACPGGTLVMSVIGFEQAGGTSTDAKQRFFFDIFDSRPLPFGRSDERFGPAWRWWGSVRIASYPQQISTSVAQFAAQFASQVGGLAVNRLANFGEFRAGIERRVKGSRKNFLPSIGVAQEQTSFGAIGYFGGLASFSAPGNDVQVFTVPVAATAGQSPTPQRVAFEGAFPISKYPLLYLPTTQYVGFAASDHSRFYWQYAAGLRMTTRFFDPDNTLLDAPALFSATFGQNELVTGGHRRGVVATFEGFYPLPLGARGKNAQMFYLFGRADLRLGSASLGQTPLALQPATMSGGAAVPPTNPNVAIIALPSNRDLYSIGVGIDAIQVIGALRSAASTNKIATSGGAASTGAKPPNTTGAKSPKQ